MNCAGREGLGDCINLFDSRSHAWTRMHCVPLSHGCILINISCLCTESLSILKAHNAISMQLSELSLPLVVGQGREAVPYVHAMARNITFAKFGR